MLRASHTHTHTQEAAFLVQIYIANDISARTVFTCYIMSADSVSLTFTFGPLCAVALDSHRQWDEAEPNWRNITGPITALAFNTNWIKNLHTAIFHSSSHPVYWKRMFESCENMTVSVSVSILCPASISVMSQTRPTCAQSKSVKQITSQYPSSLLIKINKLHPEELRFELKQNMIFSPL